MNKDFILKKRKDFLRVAKGEHVVSSTVILQAAPSLCENPSSYKIGFTTTKKIGSAVERNRARRRMRAVAREFFPQYGLNHIEYVMIGRFCTATCPFSALRKDLKWALKKINKAFEEKSEPDLTLENISSQPLENLADCADEKNPDHTC